MPKRDARCHGRSRECAPSRPAQNPLHRVERAIARSAFRCRDRARLAQARLVADACIFVQLCRFVSLEKGDFVVVSLQASIQRGEAPAQPARHGSSFPRTARKQCGFESGCRALEIARPLQQLGVAHVVRRLAVDAIGEGSVAWHLLGDVAGSVVDHIECGGRSSQLALGDGRRARRRYERVTRVAQIVVWAHRPDLVRTSVAPRRNVLRVAGNESCLATAGDELGRDS